MLRSVWLRRVACGCGGRPRGHVAVVARGCGTWLRRAAVRLYLWGWDDREASRTPRRRSQPRARSGAWCRSAGRVDKDSVC
eukprot:7218113-Prymnesium_polylepis.1